MLKFIFNITFSLIFFMVSAQSESKKDTVQVRHHNKFHLKKANIRLGFDIGNFIIGKFNGEKKLNFRADSNIYKDYFLSFSTGTEENLFDNGLLNVYTQGYYYKLGIDYNIYKNWQGMNNQISIGLHFGNSNFDAILQSYRINQPRSIFSPQIINTQNKLNFQNKNWLELTSNLQVEILHNIYFGYNISIKYLLASQKTSNFELTYIPGFYKVNSNSKFGFGIQYFVSYYLK